MITAFKKTTESVPLTEKEHIEILGEFKTADAVRELIQIYKNCNWRETKFQILSEVSKLSHQRSFQFLFQIALEHKDLPLSEKAIQCLSMMNNPVVRRFLNHQYKSGPSYLKPALIKALAAVPDRTLAHDFFDDLKKAMTSDQDLLAKNLTLALGEFKYAPAAEYLFEIVSNKKNRDIALSAVVSLGKILRSAEKFETLDSQFKKDSFEYQIYQTSLHQIQFRSQWKLEDYLQKYYSSQKYHPALFFEIASFAESEIIAGLELFATNDNFEKTLTLLSHLPHSISEPLYLKFLSVTENKNIIFSSLSQHQSADYKKLILQFKDIANGEWLNALIHVLPNADEIFKDLFLSDEYTHLPDDQKMQMLNSLSDYLSTYTGDSKKINSCGKWIETCLYAEKNESLIGRWLRLMSDSYYEPTSVTSYVSKNIKNKKIAASALYYMKSNPHHSFSEVLLQSYDELVTNLKFGSAYFKALTAQSFDSATADKFSPVIKKTWLLNDINLNIDLLKFIEKHPLIDLKPLVLEGLASIDHQTQLFSVIAAKMFKDESLSEILAPYLKSQNVRIKGRTLDTLLAQPGLRAKRLVIDSLKENISDIEYCDKVIRSFNPPENSSDYFCNIVSEIIHSNPNHELIENLLEFQIQLRASQKADVNVGFSSNAPDIQKIEKDLEKKLIHYKFYDETAKSALRSAEVPFHHPEMFDRYIDKSVIILGYSKAIDIILEKQLGRKILFPALEKRMFEFQNAIHSLGLNEDYPNGEKILKNLSLQKEFSAQSLPVHKMTLVASGILNTKIINEHFKILDGLRAWSVILLLFGRKSLALPKALVPFLNDDTTTVTVAKKLMWLQDIRNPLAHRQTIIDFKSLEEIRAEVFQILVLLNPLFEKK